MGFNRVGGLTVIAEATPVIQAATYATGELIAPLIELVGGNTEHWSVPWLPHGTGIVLTVAITDLAKQSVPIDVVFFDTNPSNTTFTLNAAFDIDDADIINALPVVHVTDWTDFNDNSIGQPLSPPNLAFDLRKTGGTLYAALVARGAPTYASTTDLTLRVGVLQD